MYRYRRQQYTGTDMGSDSKHVQIQDVAVYMHIYGRFQYTGTDTGGTSKQAQIQEAAV